MRAKKSLGQHFLRSPDTAHHIAEAADVTSADTVLEIGPGTGVLTDALLSRGAVVYAIEKDEALADDLSIAYHTRIKDEQLHVYTGDILETDIEACGVPCRDYIVVANIPYYITGKLLRKLLAASCKPKRMVLLLQDEVAQRIVARGGVQSLLSISVAAYGSPRYIKRVPAGAFMPPPNVDSAILRIDDIRSPFETKAEETTFFALLHNGFDQKRKQLGKKLRAAYAERATKALLQCDIQDMQRAEELSVSDWRCLAQNLKE